MIKTNRPTGAQHTIFYTHDKEQLKALLKELDLLAHSYFKKGENGKGKYLKFNKRLTDEQIGYIKNNFDVLKPYENNKEMVFDGFEGCLITGKNLKFNYK